LLSRDRPELTKTRHLYFRVTTLNDGRARMSMLTTTDGVEIFYKDCGSGHCLQPWLAPLERRLGRPICGFPAERVSRHPLRPPWHGRSAQIGVGHDMGHYADDLAAVTAHLDLQDAMHVGHSIGGGEVVRYLARRGEAASRKRC
jgi:non-heme chloroperoxidase